MKQIKPADYQALIGDMYYKTGVHDHVYMWLNGAWTRSSKSKFQVQNEMIMERSRLDNAFTY